MCRHEITTNLQQIINKASDLIKNNGKFYIIIPSNRLCECVLMLGGRGFEVKRIEMYHTNSAATVCLLESVKCGKSGVLIKVLKEGV